MTRTTLFLPDHLKTDLAAFARLSNSTVSDLLRIATGGRGVLPSGALHPDLVQRLVAEASKTARHVLLMCIRALDYMPPIEITFGDFLRAIVTADYDLDPDDSRARRRSSVSISERDLYAHASRVGIGPVDFNQI